MLETGLGGKVCLVTGAAKGIGLAVARLLEAEGAQLALADNDGAGLTATDVSADALRIAADLSTRAEVQRVLAAEQPRFAGRSLVRLSDLTAAKKADRKQS